MYSKIDLFSFPNPNDNTGPLFSTKASTTTRTIQQVNEINPVLTLINTLNPLKSQMI